MRTINRITAGTLLIATVGAAGIAGCSNGGYHRDDYYDRGGYAYDGYDDRPSYYYNDPYRYGYGYGHGGRYYRDHRDYHRESRSRVRVPRDADVVANGDRPLEYTAEQSGRVYVRDEKTGKVIYRGRLDPGDELKVAADAKGRRVSVDGRTVRGDLSAKPREREVFFRPDRGTAASPSAVHARRSAQQAAAREARQDRAEARSEARAAARNESRSGSGKKND